MRVNLALASHNKRLTMKTVAQRSALVASLLCLADAAHGMVTIPLTSRPIERRDTTGTNVPAKDWIMHSADLQVRLAGVFTLFAR